VTDRVPPDSETARPGFVPVAAAFIRRDLAIAASYRLAFVMRGLAVLMAFAALYYLAQFVGVAGSAGPGARYGDAGYMGFWLVGVTVGDFFYASVSALPRLLRRAQLEGTLEAMFATPTPAAYVVIATPLSEAILIALRSTALFAVGSQLFAVDLSAANWLLVVCTLGLAGLAFAGLGLVGGAVTLALRRSDPITAGAAILSTLIGGVLYPVDVLPETAARAAYLLPLAPTLEALRQALFAGAGAAIVGRELATLAMFAGFAGLVGTMGFAACLARSRASGSLSHY
jgi:ABC-2 type transport system permease protein